MDHTDQSNVIRGTPGRPELRITDEMRHPLTVTAKWGRFLSILGFVLAAFIMLAGIALMLLSATFIPAGLTKPFAMVGTVGVGVGYILVGLLYYFPSKFLFDFSGRSRQALAADDQESLVVAFSRLKSFFKFWGIVTIIMIIVYILGILALLTPVMTKLQVIDVIPSSM